MIELLVSWLVLSLLIWAVAAVLPGFEVNGFKGALVTGALFGTLNWALGWFLFAVIGVGTLGLGFLLAFLTHLVVNALLLKLTDAITRSFYVRGFGHALAGAMLISLFGVLTSWVIDRGVV